MARRKRQIGMRASAAAKAVLSRLIALHPFYVSRPHLWTPWLWEIDARIAVCAERKFCYVRVPKSANTAVTATLFVHERGVAPAGHLDGKRMFRRPSAIASLSASRLEGYFCFSFVRNPYHRTLSAYLSKLVARGDRTPYREIGAAIRRRAGGELSFAAFCAYLAEGGLHANPHWYPQCEFVDAVGAGRMDFVGRVENLADGMAQVTRRLFGEARGTTAGGSVHTGAASRLAEHYDERSRAIVAALYREDFQRFGYDASSLA